MFVLFLIALVIALLGGIFGPWIELKIFEKSNPPFENRVANFFAYALFALLCIVYGPILLFVGILVLVEPYLWVLFLAAGAILLIVKLFLWLF